MVVRIILSAALAALNTDAQTERTPASQGKGATATEGRPGSTGRGPILQHVAEPIVIRDGSLKIDVYSTSETGVVVQNDTVIVNGAGANKATLLVPTRVIRVTGPGSKTVIGKIQTSSIVAHPTMEVRRYVYEVEQLERGKFVHYTELVFQFANNTWRIAPKGAEPLKLMGCGAPVALSGVWANHFQSTCEYGEGEFHLRLGSVTVEPLRGVPTKINLGTGCSEFRIEPFNHPRHFMTFDHPPCGGLRPDPAVSYPKVQVKGVTSITAIDLSLVKAKGEKE